MTTNTKRLCLQPVLRWDRSLAQPYALKTGFVFFAASQTNRSRQFLVNRAKTNKWLLLSTDQLRREAVSTPKLLNARYIKVEIPYVITRHEDWAAEFEEACRLERVSRFSLDGMTFEHVKSPTANKVF